MIKNEIRLIPSEYSQKYSHHIDNFSRILKLCIYLKIKLIIQFLI
jgi:hypothetical protein